jgi:hypothetical protein
VGEDGGGLRRGDVWSAFVDDGRVKACTKKCEYMHANISNVKRKRTLKREDKFRDKAS